MKVSLKTVTKYAIYLYVICIIAANSVGDLSVKIARILLFAFLLLYIINRKTMIKTAYTKWALLFLLLNLIMARFATSQEVAESYAISLLYIVVIDIMASQYLLKNECFYGVFHCVILGAILKALRSYLTYGFLVFLNSRYTEETSANSIGLFCALAVVFCFMLYKLRKQDKELKKYRYFYLLGGFLNLIFMLLSGSRKAFVFLLGPLLIYLFLSSKNKKSIIRNTVIVLAVIAIASVAVMKIPALYQILGQRIVSMLSGLAGGITDNSTSMRLKLIQRGIGWFKERPWFGHGMLNYKVLNTSFYNLYYYAHNNYIELLVDCGLIGTMIYYFIYFWILRNGAKLYKRTADVRIGYTIGIMISLAVCEIGLVTYFTASYQFIIMTLFSLCHSMNSAQKKAVRTLEKYEMIDDAKIS